MVHIGVPAETAGETRVALVPETVAKLTKSGLAVLVQQGAGISASHRDQAYANAGATLIPDSANLYGQAEVILKVREPQAVDGGGHEADLLREGTALISFLSPARHPEVLERLAARRITAFSMDLIPRITRAQKMDALSSMSTVAGYKAALIAAASLGKFFPLLMTAAGTIAPARVFVLGAGVAGLQAIATSRRLGAVVEAFDVRPAVREEVQSLGATFVALDLADESLVGRGGYARALTAEQEEKERELIHKHVQSSDIVITTAMVPGRKAPVLITETMVRDMRPGSVIVDLAAEMGGNCELTKPGQQASVHGVTIHGPVNLSAALPVHASQMYSRNVSALLLHLLKDGAWNVNFGDEITRETCVTHEGRIRGEDERHQATPAATGVSGEPPAPAPQATTAKVHA